MMNENTSNVLRYSKRNSRLMLNIESNGDEATTIQPSMILLIENISMNSINGSKQYRRMKW